MARGGRRGNERPRVGANWHLPRVQPPDEAAPIIIDDTDDDVRNEFARIVQALNMMKPSLAVASDVLTLADFARVRVARNRVWAEMNRRDMYFARTAAGAAKSSPLMQAFIALDARCRSYGRDFGLSPGARSSLTAPSKGDEEDDNNEGDEGDPLGLVASL